MVKLLCWFVLFAVPLMLSASKTASGQTQPQATPNGFDTPICYMQAADGRLLDLTDLCGPRTSVVAIVGVSYSSGFATGRVLNQSEKTVDGVKIHYEVLTQDGNIMERDAVDAEPQVLSPGQLALFETVVPAGGRMASLSVTWRDRN